jgi:hypothetical protein
MTTEQFLDYLHGTDATRMLADDLSDLLALRGARTRPRATCETRQEQLVAS